MVKPILAVFRATLVYSLFAGILTACGGGSGDSGAAPPAPPLPPPPPAFGANFSEIQSNVFTPTCATSGCHFGAGAPQGLRLDSINSYALLVGVPSGEESAVLRVAPGAPDNSYLIRKLEGNAATGARMPLNRPPLAASTIAIIRQWITDGAIDDRAQSTEPVRVTSLTPAPGAALIAVPADIRAGFDRDLDASTVNAMTFIVEGSGGDGSFSEGNETQLTAASVSVPASNAASAEFDLSAVAVPDDTYRVRLLGAGASMILDLGANALDGEFSGAFPSGDGTQGGDFEATFTVTTPVVIGPTLDQIQAVVFGPTCSSSSCHSGPASNNLPSGMDLTSADASLANLVGVQSLQDSNFQRVAIGLPDSSYLIQKLEGTASGGSRMPLVGGPLDPAVVAEIRQWITDGAQR